MDNSPVAIQRAFERAMSLDPFNLAIRHNYELFLVVSKHPDRLGKGGWVFSPLSIEIDEERRNLCQFVKPPSLLAA